MANIINISFGRAGKCKEALERAAEAAAGVLGQKDALCVSFGFVSGAEIRRLNRQFRGMDKPTDVLSFPMLGGIKEFSRKNYPLNTMETGEVMLGSIAICPSIAEKEANEANLTINAELCLLFTHGLLHLLGFDHMTRQDGRQMRKLESLILGKAGEK